MGYIGRDFKFSVNPSLIMLVTFDSVVCPPSMSLPHCLSPLMHKMLISQERSKPSILREAIDSLRLAVLDIELVRVNQDQAVRG
jgi:hypothetical protein